MRGEDEKGDKQETGIEILYLHLLIYIVGYISLHFRMVLSRAADKHSIARLYPSI